MKINYIKRLAFLLPVMLICLTGCNDDDEKSSLGAVTNITWTPTSGGAIISFVAPQSTDLLYVKAVYVNSLGEQVYNVVSIYGNQIEIEGLTDETKEYTVDLYAVDKKGLESAVTSIKITPGRSYINVIFDNLTITEIVGGVELQWENPSGADSGGKIVHITLNYKSEDGETKTRYISSSKQFVRQKIRGIEPGTYFFSYMVEDFSGNVTLESTPVKLVALEEVEIPKYTDDENGYRTYIWKLVADQTTLKEVWENRNANIFDGIVDTKEKADDNSYAGTNRDQYGGSFPWGSDQMDIVIDLNNVVNISRVRAWQRAYNYGWNPYAQTTTTNNSSDDYNYYRPSNLKSFDLYGSVDATPNSWFLIKECEIEEPKWGTRDEWYGHTNVWMPTKESFDAALEGHLWELDVMTTELRYIRVRFTSNWDKSNSEVSGLSELTLYGSIVKND